MSKAEAWGRVKVTIPGITKEIYDEHWDTCVEWSEEFNEQMSGFFHEDTRRQCMESYRAQFDQWLATKNAENFVSSDAVNEVALARRTVLSAESDHRLAKREARPKKVTIQDRREFTLSRALNIEPMHTSAPATKARADARAGRPQPSQSSGHSSKQAPKWG